MCILSVCALPKVVGYYDVSVLSMSVMGFQKKLDGEWVGVVSSIQFGFGFLECFNFTKPLTVVRSVVITMHLVMSIFMYACDSWIIIKDRPSMEKRILAFEYICYIRQWPVHGITHLHNVSIHRRVVERIYVYDTPLEVVKKRKVIWFGHVVT